MSFLLFSFSLPFEATCRSCSSPPRASSSKSCPLPNLRRIHLCRAAIDAGSNRIAPLRCSFQKTSKRKMRLRTLARLCRYTRCTCWTPGCEHRSEEDEVPALGTKALRSEAFAVPLLKGSIARTRCLQAFSERFSSVPLKGMRRSTA